MEETAFEEFLRIFTANLSSFLALLGVLLGAALSFFFTVRVKSKDYKLRISEKMFERKLKAHEEILTISKEMRLVTGLPSDKDANQDSNFPLILESKDSFYRFYQTFPTTVNPNSHLISIHLFRELNYIQDYLYNFNVNFHNIESEFYPGIGTIIKDDFIDLAQSLEKEVLKFFENDIYKMGIPQPKNQHHKYSREETIKRLDKTKLRTLHGQLSHFLDPDLLK